MEILGLANSGGEEHCILTKPPVAILSEKENAFVGKEANGAEQRIPL